MSKISVVIVTFNRIECLKRVLDSVRNQTVKVDPVIVVNNGSTDGTREWLEEQEGIYVIHQDNVGGSGGFYRGIQEALKFKNEWIWCMDDDVYPHSDCLENLLRFNKTDVGILCPKRIQNGKVFVSEYKKLNLSNPFKRLHLAPLSVSDTYSDMPVPIEGMVFEGPLIKRGIIEKIGLPNKN